MSIAYNRRKKGTRRSLQTKAGKRRAEKKAMPLIQEDARQYIIGEINRQDFIGRILWYERYGLRSPIPLMNEISDLLCRQKTLPTQHQGSVHITEKEYQWADNEIKAILSPLIEQSN